MYKHPRISHKLHKVLLLHKKQYHTLLTAVHYRRKAVYKQGNSRDVNARLRNFQYERTRATDLLPLRDVFCPALEGA